MAAKKKSSSKKKTTRKKTTKKKSTGKKSSKKKTTSAKASTAKESTTAESSPESSPPASMTPPVDGAKAEEHAHLFGFDLAGAFDAVHNKFNSVMHKLGDLATHRAPEVATQATQRATEAAEETGEALERAASSFKRMVGQVVDDQMSEMLPPLVELRNELTAYDEEEEDDSVEAALLRRTGQTLDHVLSLAGVDRYDARPGETFDPLIHLAVSETTKDGLADGTVAEAVAPGFRSQRGKVIAPAKVRVNRS